MLHRIRKAMECEDTDKMEGPTEADTTYVGGAAENMHKDKREKRIKGLSWPTRNHRAGTSSTR